MRKSHRARQGGGSVGDLELGRGGKDTASQFRGGEVGLTRGRELLDFEGELLSAFEVGFTKIVFDLGLVFQGQAFEFDHDDCIRVVGERGAELLGRSVDDLDLLEGLIGLVSGVDGFVDGLGVTVIFLDDEGGDISVGVVERLVSGGGLEPAGESQGEGAGGEGEGDPRFHMARQGGWRTLEMESRRTG